MNEWTEYKLGSIADLKAGATVSAKQFGSGVPYITVRELYENRFIAVEKAPLAQLTNNEIERFSLRPKDIVFGKSSVKRAGIGFPAQFNNHNEAVCFSNFSIRVRPTTNIIDPDFLFYVLRSDNVRRWIIAYSQASVLTNLNQDIINAIPIYASRNTQEQKKIASILTSVDDVIEKTESQISKLQELKKGMMQELLTKGIGHTEFKDSAVGQIPVEWNIALVVEIADIVDSMHQTPSFSEIGMPMVRVTEIRQDEILNIIGAELVDEDTFTSFSRNYQPMCGDTLIARVGAYFGATAFIANEMKFCLGQNTASIRPIDIHPQYLFDCLNSGSVRSQMEDAVAVGAQPSLSLKSIKELKIPLPSLGEQVTISSSINSIRKRISIMSVKLNQFKAFKKSLMQDLLTGKVRVKV